MKNIVGHLRSILGIYGGKAGEPLSFKEVFRCFREVLDTNNKALEIITDMGEKLGGEYIFDINYINRAYSELSATMNRSIQIFDILTRKRYSRLHTVFEQIDNHVKQIIYDVVSASGRMIVFYEDITWDLNREVGGKNISLAEMKNDLRLNVPEAFAITTRAFDEFIKYNGLAEKIISIGKESETNGSSLSGLRELILNSKIPPELDDAIDSAIKRTKAKCGENCFMAVRSSAEEEDGEFSFAGQFETILNVPLESKAIEDAYKRVVASLYSANSMTYQKKLGYEAGKLKMAVGCVVMVDAAVSGVIYSVDPHDMAAILINATWGLGTSVVEGQTDADLYRVKRNGDHKVIGEKIGRKESMIINLKDGGIEKITTPDEMIMKPCLTTEEATELSRLAVSIERHFRKPQDIEWAIDREGSVFILQSRPLRIQRETKLSERLVPNNEIDPSRILMKGKGTVVQKGVGAGRVFIFKKIEDLDNFPRGAVLVAGQDSSIFAHVMPYVSAIITDTGTPTSHMASLCREFRVPTIVNANDATQALKHGQEITVSAGDGEITVYDGIIRELVENAAVNSIKMEDIYEFRKKRYVLRYVSPLNLIDPLLEDFTQERCKTMHDILRFIHEKSVAELVDGARYGSDMLKKHAAVKLDLPIPAGIIVIDISEGLSIAGDLDKATSEQITSIPLRAIIKGIMHPGVWHSDMVSLKAKDFLSSMMRMSDITMDASDYVGYNVAVASKEYVNLSLRFGYHFNMLDCYCSENARNNHIYFRFVGGATDLVKRSRRVELIASVLKEYGFNLKIKGDLIIARLANMRQEEIEKILEQLGRLIAYTRQLDALLHNDSDVERYAKNFIEERYEL